MEEMENNNAWTEKEGKLQEMYGNIWEISRCILYENGYSDGHGHVTTATNAYRSTICRIWAASLNKIKSNLITECKISPKDLRAV